MASTLNSGPLSEPYVGWSTSNDEVHQGVDHIRQIERYLHSDRHTLSAELVDDERSHITKRDQRAAACDECAIRH